MQTRKASTRARPATRRAVATVTRSPRGAAEGLFETPLKHRTLEALAYEHIRTALVQGRLAPGQRIVASAVARAAGISRIPVLQALRRLESEGFVRINPHRDVVVSGLSPEEFRERFLLMAALEALCLREAHGKIAPAAIMSRSSDLRRFLLMARLSSIKKTAI